MARNAKNTRMCSGCMARKDKSEFVCIRKTPDGVSVGDFAPKTGGRSAYLCPDVKCMEKSIKRKCFTRSLRCELPPDFYDKLRDYFKKFNLE